MIFSLEGSIIISMLSFLVGAQLGEWVVWVAFYLLDRKTK